MDVRAKNGEIITMPDSPMLADILKPGNGLPDLVNVPTQTLEAAPDVSPEQLRRLASVLVTHA